MASCADHGMGSERGTAPCRESRCGCFLAPAWVSWRFMSAWKCPVQNPAPSEAGDNKNTHALG